MRKLAASFNPDPVRCLEVMASSPGLAELVPRLRPGLLELHLPGTPNESHDWRPLFERDPFQGLRTLFLYGQGLDDAAVERLAALPSLRSVRKLRLGSPALGPETLAALGRLQLRSLEVGGNIS